MSQFKNENFWRGYTGSSWKEITFWITRSWNGQGREWHLMPQRKRRQSPELLGMYDEYEVYFTEEARCEHLAQDGYKKVVCTWDKSVSGAEATGHVVLQGCGKQKDVLQLMPEEDVKEWFASYNWWAIDGEVRYGKHFFKEIWCSFSLISINVSWFLFSFMLSPVM